MDGSTKTLCDDVEPLLSHPRASREMREQNCLPLGNNQLDFVYPCPLESTLLCCPPPLAFKRLCKVPREGL
ncbi:hypothetical protein CEXT_285511 [Caerostris extrusa]|uniref:Uncharacterized protein n=1 Tax=Caerostris extrusa TaxID=172846 RepID=A0AAV4VB75_CAEEX|nr:hypothetical protein CEXT_285511 [Caerostris extrusa]